MGSITEDTVRRQGSRPNRGPRPSLLLLAIALLCGLAGTCAATSLARSSKQTTVIRTPPSCAHTTLQPSDSNLPTVEAATLCLINALRTAHHLHALRFNADLHAVAAGQASEMVLGDYFGDDNRAGQTPLQRIVASSYPAHAARVSTAQNIGWGTGPDATPAAMVQAWTRSAPHLRIILTAGFRDIGIGVTPAAPSSVNSGQVGATYTVEFGVRRTSAPAARKTSAPASGPTGHTTATGAGLTGGTAG
jgi:uncharacterized protein YkwD